MNDEFNLDDYDWIDENPENGRPYYGKDDGEGTTDWYNDDGDLDCSTPTPDEDDLDEWTRRL